VKKVSMDFGETSTDDVDVPAVPVKKLSPISQRKADMEAKKKEEQVEAVQLRRSGSDAASFVDGVCASVCLCVCLCMFVCTILLKLHYVCVLL
jgi:hypothetical protein